MKLIRDLDQLPDRLRGGAVSIGNFDGVHRGHARIVERLRVMARRVGGKAAALTFEPHPARILRPEAAPAPLCWLERKAALLGELGVDAVIAFPTDGRLLRLDARQFFDRVLVAQLGVRGLVEGRDFFFGRGRSGNVRVLQQFCDEAGVLIDVVDPVEIDGRPVSSSWLRALIRQGEVKQAWAILGRPHRIRGRVVRGAGRGAGLGFPTANLAAIDTLLPQEGIYAGRAWVGPEPSPAAISLGPNPTFHERQLKIEVYLIGFDGVLYGRQIEVDFLARLRDIDRFDSVGELVAQMQLDVEAARQIAAETA